MSWGSQQKGPALIDKAETAAQIGGNKPVSPSLRLWMAWMQSG